MIAILVNGPADGRKVTISDDVRNLIIPLAPDWDKARYTRMARDDDGYALFEWMSTTKITANGDSEVVQ